MYSELSLVYYLTALNAHEREKYKIAVENSKIALEYAKKLGDEDTIVDNLIFCGQVRVI